MGARAVRAAMAQYRDLDDAAMRLLVHMAGLALDPPGRKDTPELAYFGGWELQAWHLGYDVPAGDNPRDRTRRETIRRYTQRRRSTLVAAKAIEPISAPAPGRTAVWRVNVEL